MPLLVSDSVKNIEKKKKKKSKKSKDEAGSEEVAMVVDTEGTNDLSCPSYDKY